MGQVGNLPYLRNGLGPRKQVFPRPFLVVIRIFAAGAGDQPHLQQAILAAFFGAFLAAFFATFLTAFFTAFLATFLAAFFFATGNPPSKRLVPPINPNFA